MYGKVKNILARKLKEWFGCSIAELFRAVDSKVHIAMMILDRKWNLKKKKENSYNLPLSSLQKYAGTNVYIFAAGDNFFFYLSLKYILPLYVIVYTCTIHLLQVKVHIMIHCFCKENAYYLLYSVTLLFNCLKCSEKEDCRIYIKGNNRSIEHTIENKKHFSVSRKGTSDYI